MTLCILLDVFDVSVCMLRTRAVVRWPVTKGQADFNICIRNHTVNNDTILGMCSTGGTTTGMMIIMSLYLG